VLPCLQISAHDINSVARPFWDCNYLLTEVDRDALGLDVARGPSEVVGEFLPRGYQGAVVNEGDKTALGVEVVQEGYRRLGVAKSREILEPAFAGGLDISMD